MAEKDLKNIVEYPDGTKYWYANGELHREDGPAIEDTAGIKKWYFQGKLHREGGPAVEWRDGYKEWMNHGLLHREDGPAVERNDGYKVWYFKGRIHRIDGPAIEFPDGRKEWWIDGLQVNPPQKMMPTMCVPQPCSSMWITDMLPRRIEVSDKMYVAVLPNGEEYYGTVNQDLSHSSKEDLCRSAFNNYGYKTSRKNPQKVQVYLFELAAKNGSLVKKSKEVFYSTPPVPYMTAEERDEEVNALLNCIPYEFHPAIKNFCHESSSDYETQVQFLEDFVNCVKEPFKKYTDRIKQE